MGKKELAALAVLGAGGYWRKAQETQYRGGEKFAYRLREKGGTVVPGIGYQTWLKLANAGLLQWRECEKSTVWPEE